MLKQYIGIVRDHSGSMQSLAKQAMSDYNSNIEIIQREARRRDIDTIVSVVECGIGLDGVNRAVVNSGVERLKPLTSYPTPGGTPLFDSVLETINLLRSVPDANDPNVAFLVMVITDGEELHSKRITGAQLGAEIKALQRTDRWTFTFRTPYGYGQTLASKLGIPMGNILEWEQTERGFERATVATMSAASNYYSERARGSTGSSSFYANSGQVGAGQIKRQLLDITGEVKVFSVKQGGEVIRPFVERRLDVGEGMQVGAAFYQLSKPEPVVQPQKQIVLRDKASGRIYGGQSARDILGLPLYGNVKLSPGDHGQWDVFVQSTSVNRNLVAGTDVVYWPKVRY